jgi:predicted O-methyltransferase YrrM
MKQIFRLKEYLRYLIRAQGLDNLHPPFAYDFAANVLHDKRTFYAYSEIEAQREKLLKSKQFIAMQDGSSSLTPMEKTVGSIAKKSLKPAKQAQLLFRIVDRYGALKILELGTSLGITTLYVASANKNSRVISLEGNPSLVELAQKQINNLGIKNITLMQGDFNETLLPALQQLGTVDFIFFDGNHRKIPTLQYFRQSLPFKNQNSIFVFDDIYWSEEMKESWEEIKSHGEVRLTIDLYYFGIVFFRKELSKQHFTLRF